MLNSILGLLFSILGLITAKLTTTGLIANILSLFSLLLFVVALIQCFISFISSFFTKNIFKFIFGFTGLSLSIYGLVKYSSIFQLIQNIF